LSPNDFDVTSEDESIKWITIITDKISDAKKSTMKKLFGQDLLEIDEEESKAI